LYDNIEKAIIYVVGYGHDYEQVLQWNLGGFFKVLDQVGKVQKAKSGVK